MFLTPKNQPNNLNGWTMVFPQNYERSWYCWVNAEQKPLWKHFKYQRSKSNKTSETKAKCS